jgi:hypothetical protein
VSGAAAEEGLDASNALGLFEMDGGVKDASLKRIIGKK